MSLRMENLRTSLVILNIDIGLATLVCLVSLRMGNMRISLVILNIDRGLAYLGVSGEFKYVVYADRSGYPLYRQRSGLPWSVW